MENKEMKRLSEKELKEKFRNLSDDEFIETGRKISRALGFCEGVLSEMKKRFVWMFYYWLLGITTGIVIAMIIIKGD